MPCQASAALMRPAGTMKHPPTQISVLRPGVQLSSPLGQGRKLSWALRSKSRTYSHKLKAGFRTQRRSLLGFQALNCRTGAELALYNGNFVLVLAYLPSLDSV